MKCEKCGKSAHEIKCWLERVNEKGVKGKFECRPYCGAVMSAEEAILEALEIKVQRTEIKG